MRGDTEAPVHVPMMRALLFTDLCDSTLLVERMGDAAAAELFQDHDRLVMALQQRWTGQQIDRSDGLFMLFERPVDALGFALDYQRGLQALGGKRNILLRARMGLHVGEVLLWNNSTESIALGAKPVEVEGLAKPMAARLMQLAQPGQFLVSATAESMVRRAAGDLGEVAQGLKWKSFGRWRFKGVAQSMEVFGLQDAGMASTGRPRQSAKASRDIPFWRQPAMMTAEVTLAAALLVGGWFLTRPQPAIAFAERDWVVLTDVRNFTGNPVFDESLNEAMRISLEQSRHVNVLSELKVRDTLGRMRQSPDTPLDEALALEVALRDGVRAVVVPSIRETEDRLQVTLDVIDPHTRRTVYSSSAAGRGMESVLTSADTVVATLRGQLGESREGILRDSSPLPDVTTGNLDAMRAYALGVQAFARQQDRDALEHFEQATRIDPNFAFAYIGSMRVHYSLGRMTMAELFYRRAVTLRDHLTPRDALYLAAWGAEFEGAPGDVVERRWKALSDLYPDYFGARANFAIARANRGDYAGALAAGKPLLSEQNAARALSLDFLGRMSLALNDVDEALQYFVASTRAGQDNGSRLMAAAYLARGDWKRGEEILARLPDELPSRIERITLAAERQDWSLARQLAEASRRECGSEPVLCELFAVIELNVRWSSGDAPSRSQWNAVIEQGLRTESNVDRSSRLFTLLAAAWLAQRAGHPGIAEAHMAQLQKNVDALKDDRCRQMLAIVQANQLLGKHKADDALALLRPWEGDRSLIALHVTLRQIQIARGDVSAENSQRAWLSGQRGLAYADNVGSFVLQTRNVLDVGPP